MLPSGRMSLILPPTVAMMSRENLSELWPTPHSASVYSARLTGSSDVGSFTASIPPSSSPPNRFTGMNRCFALYTSSKRAYSSQSSSSASRERSAYCDAARRA